MDGLDLRHTLIEQGHEARDIRNIIGEQLVLRQDNVLKKLIAEYKNGSLTNERLWAGLGEIVGVNDYLKELTKKVDRGDKALQAEVNHG